MNAAGVGCDSYFLGIGVLIALRSGHAQLGWELNRLPPSRVVVPTGPAAWLDPAHCL